MIKLFVHVLKRISVLRQIVGQNALSIANVLSIKPASIKNARTHVQIHVALRHNVLWKIIVQFARVPQTLREIHSLVAIAFPLCMTNRQQNVLPHAHPIHVVHTLNVALLAIHMFALAYLTLLAHHQVVVPNASLTPNAQVKKLALIWNARILVPAVAALTQIVTFWITYQYVRVKTDIREIRLLDVHMRHQVSTFFFLVIYLWVYLFCSIIFICKTEYFGEKSFRSQLSQNKYQFPKMNNVRYRFKSRNSSIERNWRNRESWPKMTQNYWKLL